MSTRRRGHQNTTKDGSSAKKEDKDNAEPIDETEQEQVVKALREEAFEQIELIHNIFSRVCEGAMVLCLLLGVTTHDLWGWIHVIGSVFLHWGSMGIAATAKPGNHGNEIGALQKTTILPILVLVIVAAVFLPLSRNTRNTNYYDDHMHHLGLALANVVTMLGALYLKHDSQSTKKALEELEKSKYHYKSL